MNRIVGRWFLIFYVGCVCFVSTMSRAGDRGYSWMDEISFLDSVYVSLSDFIFFSLFVVFLDSYIEEANNYYYFGKACGVG